MGIRSMGGSVTYDVTHHLGREIIGGIYPPGAILPNETEICETFEVGRSAVREAVKMLAAKGLVDSRPGRGTQVLPSQGWNFFDRDVLTWLREGNPQPRIIIELLQLRIGVEPKAAELAAENGTDEQIAAIARAYDRMVEAASGRIDPVAADGSFHEAIVIATNNRFFQPFGPLIRTALTVTAPTTNAIFGHSVGDLVAHKATLDAIQSRSPEEARTYMFKMLEAVLDAVNDWRDNPNGIPRRTRSAVGNAP